MYYVVESPKVLNIPVDVAQIKHLKANKSNMFICMLTSSDIMIWFTIVSDSLLF